MKRTTLGLAQELLGILARAPGEQMQGASTQAMPQRTVKERQRSMGPPGAAPPRIVLARAIE
ncbi:MAG: hypothetical protein ABSH28_12535 [Acidobacteriota bacterium]